MTTVQIATLSLLVSFISLIVAAILACVRVLEFNRDNRSIQISYCLSDNPGEWNIIYLTNISSKPILINYWDLVWRKRNAFFGYRYEGIIPHNNEDLHLNLQPHSRKQIDFKDQYEFNWHPKNKRKVKLFLEVQIAGKKKPKYIFVYNPG